MNRNRAVRYLSRALFSCALTLLTTVAASAAVITIPTVPVGNLGNVNDTATGNVYGGVSYAYRIGTSEVTNAQYVAFLNAKAASDPLGLYNSNMGSNARGGITRSGASGTFSYATRENMADKPVNFVNWYDAIRFANWLNNGQGSGDTESGAYTILGGGATPSNGNSITRNSGATWFMTSESEWYKAAYYQPTAEGGDVDSYWLYPTHTNSAPAFATADAVGNISNPGANKINYNTGASWNGQTGNFTTVGTAGSLSDSFYGTTDQGGNATEWVETFVTGGSRAARGGAYNSGVLNLRASNRDTFGPNFENVALGFRVGTIAAVPEPSSALLGLVGGGLLLWWRKRRK